MEDMTFKERLKHIRWEGIIVEGDKLSLGRVLMIALTVAAFVIWFNPALTVPTSLMTIYLTCMAYNFGKKPVESFEKWLSSDKVDVKAKNPNTQEKE